jgi:DNA-binding transcriptional LysR family regulator
VVDETIGPEIRSHALFTDRFVGAARSDNPLAGSAVTSADYVSWPHVVTWCLGLGPRAIDEHLREAGLARTIVSSVDGFSAAMISPVAPI